MLNQNQEEGEEEQREGENGLHADDTSELLSRRNLILRQAIDEKKRKKEDSERKNERKKEDNEKNSKGKKEDCEKREKTNWDKLELEQDMWRQLRQVSIPVFNGVEKSYQS